MRNQEDEKVPIQTYGQFRDGCPKEWAEEAYKEYHAKYPGQTFKRLHERGGFGLEELVWLLVERCKRLDGKGE